MAKSSKPNQEYLSYFNRVASVELDNQVFKFEESDFIKLNRSANYWHHREDPSSWLCASTLSLCRQKFPKLARPQSIQLSAQTLNISVEKLESSLNWSANYLSWHDGGTPDENHPWPQEK